MTKITQYELEDDRRERGAETFRRIHLLEHNGYVRDTAGEDHTMLCYRHSNEEYPEILIRADGMVIGFEDDVLDPRAPEDKHCIANLDAEDVRIFDAWLRRLPRPPSPPSPSIKSVMWNSLKDYRKVAIPILVGLLLLWWFQDRAGR